jgi:glycosyltransferase involved in cell wall biosynthesis
MRRGVDTLLFNPARRDRADGVLTLGYIGRTSTEKNVQYLVEVERALREAGLTDYRIFVAGHGSLLDWLRANLRQCEIPGVLRGEALARAYANLDIFVFPSETDTYGNVVQEAMASGVPCVVTDQGGPAHIVTDGQDGFVAPLGPAFCEAVLRLARGPDLRRRMAAAALATAQKASWDSVFEEVYAAYGAVLGPLQS